MSVHSPEKNSSSLRGFVFKMALAFIACTGVSLAEDALSSTSMSYQCSSKELGPYCNGRYSRIFKADKPTEDQVKLKGEMKSGTLYFNSSMVDDSAYQITYLFRVYFRTDSSAIFAQETSDEEGSVSVPYVYYYGRHMKIRHRICGGSVKTSGIWVNDNLGTEKELMDTYEDFWDLNAESQKQARPYNVQVMYTKQTPIVGVKSLRLQHYPEKELQAGENPYWKYNYGEFVHNNRSSNRDSLQRLLDTLKKYDVRHVRLALEHDGVLLHYRDRVTQRDTVIPWCEKKFSSVYDRFKCKSEMMFNYIDMDIPYVDASLSLDSSDTIVSGELLRSEDLTLYATYKGQKKFRYQMQVQNDDGEWENYGTLYTMSLDKAVAGNENSLEIPGGFFINDDYVDLRLAIAPLDSAGDTLELVYTRPVHIKLRNKLTVTSNAPVFDYRIEKAGVIMDKENFSFTYDDSFSVTAIAPLEYRFKCWAGANSEKCFNTEPTLSFENQQIDDIAIKAVFDVDIQTVRMNIYVTQNGDKTYTSVDSSPVISNYIDGNPLKVKFFAQANEDMCLFNEGTANETKTCKVHLLLRKAEATTWDTLETMTLSSSNGFSNDVEKNLLPSAKKFKGAPYFELKAVVKEANGTQSETNTIVLNNYYTVQFKECSELNSAHAGLFSCDAIFENESFEYIAKSREDSFAFPYGSTLKLSPIVAYNANFYSWNLYDENSVITPDNYLSRDSVYQFRLDSSMVFSMGLTEVKKDTVMIMPASLKMPYAGLPNWDLTTYDNKDQNYGLAEDTSFIIYKGVQTEEGIRYTELFAFNSIDSVFTPGSYEVTVKIGYKQQPQNERDSLWACNANPVFGWSLDGIAENAEFVINKGKSPCTKTSPAYFRYMYSFSISDTSYTVRFLTWNEKTEDYDKEVKSGKVDFGETPEAPEVECPESTKEWKYTCDWQPKIKAVTGDIAYVYHIEKTKVEDSDKVPDVGLARKPLFSLKVKGRSLQVDAAMGQAYTLFDMQGGIVMQGNINAKNFNLQIPRAGSYLVRIGNQTQKVVVR